MTVRSRWSRMRLAASCSSTMAARFREKNSSEESSFGFRQRKAKNPSPLPSLEGSQRRVVGQVEMDRRDRDVVLLDGLQVRAGDVLPHVPALVDAGHEEVDPSLPENSVHGEVHAICRRPVDGVYPGPDLFDPKRLRQREGMSRRAPFAIRRDHGDRAQGAERLRERHDPLGPESVVVAHQDEGGRIAHVLPTLSGKEMFGATGLEPATPCTPFLSRGFRKILKTHSYLISLERYDNTF